MCSFEAWFFRTVDVEELLQIETCLHPGRACASFAATRGARHLDQREKNTAEASHLRLTLFHAFSRLFTLLFQPASAGGRAACALSSFKKNDKTFLFTARSWHGVFSGLWNSAASCAASCAVSSEARPSRWIASGWVGADLPKLARHQHAQSRVQSLCIAIPPELRCGMLTTLSSGVQKLTRGRFIFFFNSVPTTRLHSCRRSGSLVIFEFCYCGRAT